MTEENKTTDSANTPAAGSAATLSPAAAPLATQAAKPGKATKGGAYKATERLYYRDPASKDPAVRGGKFFAAGEELAGVDDKHLKEMEAAGQASNKVDADE